MRIKLIAASAACALIFLLPSAGFTIGADLVVEGIQKKYASLRSLRARFAQESRVASLGRSRHKEGTIIFQRPGRMRWDYEAPAPQLLVSDGETLWYFQPEQKQVVVQDLSRAFTSQTPLFFLFGEGDLSLEFTWPEGELSPSEKGIYALELSPRVETPDLVGLTLEVRAKDFTVSATVLRDAFGNVTRLEFSEEEENPDLAADLFTFSIPPGSEVVRP